MSPAEAARPSRLPGAAKVAAMGVVLRHVETKPYKLNWCSDVTLPAIRNWKLKLQRQEKELPLKCVGIRATSQRGMQTTLSKD